MLGLSTPFGHVFFEGVDVARESLDAVLVLPNDFDQSQTFEAHQHMVQSEFLVLNGESLFSLVVKAVVFVGDVLDEVPHGAVFGAGVGVVHLHVPGSLQVRAVLRGVRRFLENWHGFRLFFGFLWRFLEGVELRHSQSPVELVVVLLGLFESLPFHV